MTEIPTELVKLATEAVDQHYIRTVRDGMEVCACGSEVDAASSTRSRLWEAHYAEATIAAVLPAHERMVREQIAADLLRLAATYRTTPEDLRMFLGRLDLGVAVAVVLEGTATHVVRGPQDAPTAPVRPATGDTETTGVAAARMDDHSALRDLIAGALTTACPDHHHCTRQTTAVINAILPHTKAIADIYRQSHEDVIALAQRAETAERDALDLREQRNEAVRKGAKVLGRAERAEAALAKHRKYLDENFRQWCSPYGIAADYATRLIAHLDAALGGPEAT